MRFPGYIRVGSPFLKERRHDPSWRGPRNGDKFWSHEASLRESLQSLAGLGYAWAPETSAPVPAPRSYQLTFDIPEYDPQDWSDCEYLEPIFPRLADLRVTLKNPPPEGGGVRIDPNRFAPKWQHFWLAGAHGYAFVRDEVKRTMEQHDFVGLRFARAGVVPPWVNRVAESDEVYKLPGAPKRPIPGEKIWQIAPSITLPPRTTLPDSVVLHKPLAGRKDLPEKVREQSVREDRLGYKRSELRKLGPFDLAYIREIPPPPRPGLFNERRRMVVSRRFANYLLEHLRPMWQRRADFERIANPMMAFDADGHDYWAPVTIVEDDDGAKSVKVDSATKMTKSAPRRTSRANSTSRTTHSTKKARRGGG